MWNRACVSRNKQQLHEASRGQSSSMPPGTTSSNIDVPESNALIIYSHSSSAEAEANAACQMLLARLPVLLNLDGSQDLSPADAACVYSHSAVGPSHVSRR